MLEQFSLFEDVPTTEKNFSYLNIIHNGVEKKMSLEELFDCSVFTDLKAITFVASPNFFFKVTKEFQSVKLVLGIEDGQVAGSFVKGMENIFNISERIAFFQNLPEEIKKQILDNQFQIRFSKKGTPIHSKIYILEGNGHTRVMVGSANFTETALGNQKQFEELLVFDDCDYFEIYAKRFNEIYNETVDYIPEKIRTSNSLILNQINYVDPDVLMDTLIDEVKNGKLLTEFTEEQIEEIHEAQDKLEVEKKETTNLRQLIQIMTRKERGSEKRKLLSITSIKDKAASIKSTISQLNKRSKELDERTHIVYDTRTNQLFTSTGESNENETALIPFSKKNSNIEEIREQLLLINAFVESYRLFTVQNDVKIQSKVFEAVLYAFLSTHIWKMRDHFVSEEGRESVRRHVPPFLIIAGRSMSGKTSALEFIGKLLGNTNTPPYTPYEQLSKKNVIYDLFHSNNTISPLLVDEVDPKFFSSTAQDKGERLIKDVTNNLTGQHPVLIGTTNATGFDTNAQSSSRIYYLQIDNAFDPEKRNESGKYLGEIMKKANSILYQDFTYRLGEKVEYGEPFYSQDDFLSAGRELFKEYYRNCGLNLPQWFPTTKFNDYYERGKTLWLELYKSNTDSFEIRKDNTINVRINDFIAGGNSQERERQSLINYLPHGSVIEDNKILLIFKDKFMDFIEYDNHFKKGIFKWFR